jgi:DNA uptake protein ComE-like DNA-binding protein
LTIGRVRRALIAVIVALACGLAVPAAAAAERLDLNRATRDEIAALPIPPEVAQKIWEYRTYNRYFRSIYDVAEVEGVTPEILATLRPLVSTMPPDAKEEEFERYDASFRQVQQFLSQEGAREELADEYLDLLRDPRDINNLDLLALQSFQNVSPVDAVAILKARERAGRIENERQLRSSDGLSYWGFRNLRDFVVYEDVDRPGELHGDAQLLAFDRPYRLDEADLLTEPLPGTTPGDFDNGTAWGRRGLDSPNPALGLKLRLRLGGGWKGGILSFRNVGEEHFGETVKGFASWQARGNRRIQLDRAVVGNYRVALGQALVMDNTDFFLPRKNGYGFNVRPRRILGDLTRTQEFALRGLAVEGHAGPMRATGFVSHDKKDGIINPDGTLNRYVVMAPRFENRELEAMNTVTGLRFGLRRDAFRETLYGGNLQAHLWTGTYLGVSGWEARYDKPWDPDIDTIVPASNQDLLEARDAEVFAAYDSRRLGDFRRVVGAEFQTVYQNVALQGEYAKLDTNPQDGLDGLLSVAPEAYTLNAYMQWEDLTLQLLWRDYDVGFDNPYARAFSEDQRYDQTLIGDPFRLQNPLLSFLATGTPQMKPERGLYANMRYRVSRTVTLSALEFDDWVRADGQNGRRYVARVDWAPIFPLRFQLRQRVSSRGEQVDEDVRRFRGWESRLGVQARLSGYDTVELLYDNGKTEFAPRPRLAGSAEPGQGNPLAEVGSNGQAMVGVIEHNVNAGLQLQLGMLLYDGFFYWFEDNEFLLLDGNGIRSYFVVRSRVGDSMLFRFKVAHDRPFTNTGVDIRNFNDPFQFPFEGDQVRSTFASFRLQLDYTF